MRVEQLEHAGSPEELLDDAINLALPAASEALVDAIAVDFSSLSDFERFDARHGLST
jgi:hypothetical protein